MSNYREAPELEHQVVWLIGATSGIGEALVHQLADHCGQLVISGRSEDKLDQLTCKYTRISSIVADVTDLASMKKAAGYIEEGFGRIDTVIINAGTCEYLDVQNFDSALVKRVIDTNLMGMVHCIEAALPLLRKSQRGYLVGVASSVTYLALPRAQAYGASKAGVRYLLESMRADLANEQIDVSVVSPGFVKTPLTDRNDFEMPMRISAEQAAEAIVDGIEDRPWDIHFPKRFTLLLKLMGALPAWLRLAISRKTSTNKPEQRSDDRQRSNKPMTNKEANG